MDKKFLSNAFNFVLGLGIAMSVTQGIYDVAAKRSLTTMTVDVSCPLAGTATGLYFLKRKMS